MTDMAQFTEFKTTLAALSSRVDELKNELDEIKRLLSEGAPKPSKATKKSTPKKKNNLTINQFLDIIDELIPKVNDGTITKEDYIPCPRAQKNGASADMPCCKQSTKYLDVNGDHHELFGPDGKFAFELTPASSHFLRCNTCRTKATDPTTSRAQVLISAAIKEKDDQKNGVVKNDNTDVVAEKSAKDIVNSLTGNDELVKKHLRGSPDNTIPTPSKAKGSKFEDDFDGHLNKVGDLWYNCYNVEHEDQTLQLVVRHQSTISGSPSKRSPVCIGYTRKDIKCKEDITDTITEDLAEVPESVFKKVKKRGFKYNYEGLPSAENTEDPESETEPADNSIVIPSVKKDDIYNAKTDDESDNGDDNNSDNEYDALIDELKNS